MQECNMDCGLIYQNTVQTLKEFMQDADNHREQNISNPEWMVNKLQCLVKVLQQTISCIKNPGAKVQSLEKQTSCAVQSPPQVDPDLVQITANKSEIERRIAAFMEKKQRDVDSINRREFCSVLEEDTESVGCARTDAVFQPRMACKSHVKVTRTHNAFGPQTQYPTTDNTYATQLDRGMTKPEWNDNQDPGENSRRIPFGAQERLRNMEAELHLSANSNTHLFERLRKLEERILQLESSSPEYATCLPPPPKRKKVESQQMKYPQNLSVQEIDASILQLKRSLLNRPH